MKKKVSERTLTSKQAVTQMNHYWKDLDHMASDVKKKKNMDMRFGIKDIKLDRYGNIVSFDKYKRGAFEELEIDEVYGTVKITGKVQRIPQHSAGEIIFVGNKKRAMSELKKLKKGGENGYLMQGVTIKVGEKVKGAKEETETEASTYTDRARDDEKKKKKHFAFGGKKKSRHGGSGYGKGEEVEEVEHRTEKGYGEFKLELEATHFGHDCEKVHPDMAHNEWEGLASEEEPVDEKRMSQQAKRKRMKWKKTSGGRASARKSKKRSKRVKSGSIRVNKSLSRRMKKARKRPGIRHDFDHGTNPPLSESHEEGTKEYLDYCKGVTPGEIEEGAVLDVKDADKWTAEIKKGIKAGWVSVGKSTLGGDKNVAILIKLTLETEKEWPNKIMQNARFGMLRIATDGTMEMFASGYKVKNMRKTRIKSAKDVVSKINTWIKKVDEGISEFSFSEYISEGRTKLTKQQQYDLIGVQAGDEAKARLIDLQRKKYTLSDIKALAKKHKVHLDMIEDPVWGFGEWLIPIRGGITLEYKPSSNAFEIRGWRIDKKKLKAWQDKYMAAHSRLDDNIIGGGRVIGRGFETALELIGEQTELIEEKKKTDEEAPTNNVGSGNVDLTPHIKKKKKKYKPEEFGGHKVFVVSSQRFWDSRLGKSRYARYERYVGNDEVGEAIREFGRANPKSPIILRNSDTGAMLYLKYGKRG